MWNTFTRADRALLSRIAAGIDTLMTQIKELMSEDAAVTAAAADLTTDAQNLTTAVSALQGLVTALQAEIASNPDVVQPATLTALQTAQAAVDAITGTASSDVTADQPPAPAAPSGT
jgi:peptidoglycan hydrolase CwlO-like protein